MAESNNSEKIIHTLSSFQDTNSSSSGKSPSKPMKKDGHTYQVKRSNSSRFIRRLLGLDKDASDAIGEYIASAIAKSIATDIYVSSDKEKSPPKEMELSPDVSLVEDEQNKEIRLASRYLNSGNPRFQGATLDQVLHGREKASGKTFDKKKHAVMMCSGEKREGDTDGRILNFGQEFPCTTFKGKDKSHPFISLDKKQLYRAVKLSMALGDHDVNPGNIFVNFDTETGKTQICRIDYGHAFNDLIKNWRNGSHKPQLGEGRGNVLDFINRTSVNGGPSKLLRDYRGIIPDIEFAEVLREESKELELNISRCTAELNLTLSAASEKKTIFSSIKNSLNTLINRMGLGTPFSESITESIGHSITNAQSFVLDNMKEMKSVANLIEIQHLINEYGNDTSKAEVIAEKIKKIVSADERYLKGKSFDDPIEWVREEGEKHPKVSSINELIALKIQDKNFSSALQYEVNKPNPILSHSNSKETKKEKVSWLEKLSLKEKPSQNKTMAKE